MFITGVTPMTIYDVTSGFNIGRNISLDGQFHIQQKAQWKL